MAKAPTTIEEKMLRREQAIARHAYATNVLESRGDADTGAGVVLTQSTRTQDITAHFFRARQLKHPFKTEPVASNHERIAVLDRLRTILDEERRLRRAPHDLRVGDVIADSWGHTMRDVDFYVVVDVPTPRRVAIVRIEATLVSGDWMAGQKMPVVPDALPSDEDARIHDVSMETGEPVLTQFGDIHRPRRWSGKPVSVYSD